MRLRPLSPLRGRTAIMLHKRRACWLWVISLLTKKNTHWHPDFAPLYEKALHMHQQAEYRRGNVGT